MHTQIQITMLCFQFGAIFGMGISLLKIATSKTDFEKSLKLTISLVILFFIYIGLLVFLFKS